MLKYVTLAAMSPSELADDRASQHHRPICRWQLIRCVQLRRDRRTMPQFITGLRPTSRGARLQCGKHDYARHALREIEVDATTSVCHETMVAIHGGRRYSAISIEISSSSRRKSNTAGRSVLMARPRRPSSFRHCRMSQCRAGANQAWRNACFDKRPRPMIYHLEAGMPRPR